jgi:hypothetical protein
MNVNRGIFDSLPPSEQNGAVNPFSFAGEAPIASNPFAAAPSIPQSPFAAVPDHTLDRNVPEPGKPAKIPAPRPKVADSPFQLAGQVAAENGSAYGYEAPQVSNLVAAPFSVAPTQHAEPIQLPAAPSQHNPFSVHREPVAAAPAVQAHVQHAAAPAPQQSFGSWPQPQEVAAASSFAHHITQTAASPFAVEAAAAPAPTPAPAPVAFHAPAPAPATPAVVEEAPVFRQLELRAIFGVDREMSTDEILQRTRSLPGIKHVAKIGYTDVVALESLKATLQGLGFGGGNIRLYSGSVPIEFVRDGQTMLAVQTDGGFAPGVKEAIMIVARELEKMG